MGLKNIFSSISLRGSVKDQPNDRTYGGLNAIIKELFNIAP